MKLFKRKCCGTAAAEEKVEGAQMTIAFIGNPNCGKTTLFNAYTGANLKVANWPGVTVEKVEGTYKDHGEKIRLVDLPGTYSLTSYTMEETVSRNFILSGDVDVVINVVDASALERGLYLTLQLLELGKPVVVALNMMDIVLKRGMEIDLHRLPEMLGVPVIPVSARKRTGLDILIHAAIHHKGSKGPDRLVHEHREVSHHAHDHHSEYTMVYSDDMEDRIDAVESALVAAYPDMKNVRWHAIKTLEGDKEVREKFPVTVAGVTEKNYEGEIINEKYGFIDEIIDEVMVHKQRQDKLTDKLDGAFTHKIWGIPIFLGIMAVVFFLTFFVGDLIKGLLETAFSALSDAVSGGLDSAGASSVIKSLLVDGIIGGVGTIITFLPNIFILFLALAFLEDSGYMSRVAYVMEGIMSRLGLSGRAFIPMLLGFGCTVPAIMASRALENKRDRYKVMLITPFMSCSARLTIYILFAEMFFAQYAFLAAFSMYLLGILVAIGVAAAMHLMDKRKTAEPNYLLIELPEYKLPDARTVGIYVWEKVKDYLVKAGTTIFIATLIIWGLLHLGPTGYVDGVEMETSFAGYIGKFLTPVFAPIGLGFWQIVVALIAGISAKEVVVSSCAVLLGAAQGSAEFTGALTAIGFGPLNAVALMVFCLLYIPCAAALATIRKESKSWLWMIGTACFQLLVAYVVTLIVYQIGGGNMLATIIISCIIGACAIAAAAYIIVNKIKNKGKCGGCSGQCSGCASSCPSRNEKEDETNAE